MSSLTSDSVAIHRLRMQGAARSGAAGLAQMSGQLRRELELASWPEAPGQSWVLIRQVQARGPSYRLADQLVQATRAQVERGDADNVVRFASLADLLAALLTDLVRGQAAGRWYWRRWRKLFRLPAAAAVQQLLIENLSQLSSVCARLAQQQALTEVWLTLDEAGAGQLLQQLAQRTGFELPDSRQLEMARRNSGTNLPVMTLLPDSSLWQHWAPVLRALPLTDSRFQLALCLIGQQLAPLMLMQAPATLLVRLTDLVESLLARAAQPRPRPYTAVRDRVLPGSAAVPVRVISPSAKSTSHNSDGLETETQEISDRGTPELPLQPGQQIPCASSNAPASSQPMRTERADPKIRPLRPGDDTSSISSNDSSTPEAGPGSISQLQDSPRQALRFTPPDPDFSQFTTTQGGLLYLLNFLNRPQAQALLENYWERLPSGWGWLYRLGQTLQLDENDPIVAFIATQLGLDQPKELDQLPLLPAQGELLDLAHRWYDGAGLWQPELLQLNARVQFSPSHLDLYAPLAVVRLPVRLAGLDIDPGWLPWLGRVVSIHYE